MSVGFSEPIAQRAFLEEIVPRMRADSRIRAAWLIGSLARDSADAFSDVDLLLGIAGDDFSGIVADWRAFVDGLAATVSLQRIGGESKPTLVAVAPGCLRFDLTLCNAELPQAHGYDPVRLLFDHDGVAARMTFAPQRGADPVQQLPWLVHNFLRGLSLTPGIFARGEFLIARQGVGILQNWLIDLFLLENGGRVGGGLHLNRFLTDEQRDLLASFPPLELTPDSLLANQLAAARSFLPRARRLMATHDLPYPDEFEREVRDYLREMIGAEL